MQPYKSLKFTLRTTAHIKERVWGQDLPMEKIFV